MSKRLLLALALALPGIAHAGPPADLPRLREMLYDRQAPLQQGQAARLLVESSDEQTIDIVHQGLRQTDSADVSWP